MTIDISGWKSLKNRVSNWVLSGADKDVKKASNVLANKYKTQIKSGKNGDNSSMPNVKDVTMESPIRYGSDPAIRQSVRSSRTPLYARGRAVNSIKSKKVSEGYEIGPSTSHGDLVFSYNANSAPTKRDPLIVSDVQIDIIEDHIFDGLDKALRGK